MYEKGNIANENGKDLKYMLCNGKSGLNRRISADISNGPQFKNSLFLWKDEIDSNQA